MTQNRGVGRTGRNPDEIASIEKRGPSKWRLKVRIPADLQVPGGRRSVSKMHYDEATLRAEARRYWDDTIAVLEGDRELGRAPTGTVNLLLDEWLAHENYTDEKAETTRTAARRHANNHVRPHIGHMLAHEVTPDRLELLYAMLRHADPPDRKKGLGHAAIDNVHSTIRSAYKYALSTPERQRTWRVTENPAAKAKVPGSKRRRDLPHVDYLTVHKAIGDMFGPVSYTPAERRQLRAQNPGRAVGFKDKRTRLQPYHALYLTALMTGLRRGELCALRWRDIQVDGDAAVRVRESVGIADRADGKAATYLKGTKNDRERTVPLPDELLPYLRGLRTLVDQVRAHHGRPPTTGEHFVFGLAPRGLRSGWQAWERETPVRPDAIGSRWKKAVDETPGSPIAGLRLHDLRHVYISEMLRLTGDLATVSKVAGHSNPSFTADRYSHALPAGVDAIRAALVQASQPAARRESEPDPF